MYDLKRGLLIIHCKYIIIYIKMMMVMMIMMTEKNLHANNLKTNRDTSADFSFKRTNKDLI